MEALDLVPLPTLAARIPRVLVVDDSQPQLRLMRRVLQQDGYDCLTLEFGRDAIAMCGAYKPDAILLDLGLPDMDGLTVCRTIKALPECRLTPVLVMTGHTDRRHYLRVLEAGADDFLAKPMLLPELRARLRSAVRMKGLVDQLDDAAASLVMLGHTIEARDVSTKGHCERLSDYASRLGMAIGLDAEDVRALEQGGCLHDLGKIAVPDAVLFKPGPLSVAEFELVKCHPLVGDRICGPLRSLERVRPIVRSHHETLDGCGYPDGLTGSSVPLLAQITAVADVYDALTTDRPYRPALARWQAFELLEAECRAGKRERELVNAFIELMGESTPGLRPAAAAV